MELPKAFIISTVIYLITRVLRTFNKNDEDFDFVSVLGLAASCVMAISGITYLFDLL